MELKYVVFWINQERKIYGDDSYYVLGEWMASCNTNEEAIAYIEKLNLRSHQCCTILPIYSCKHER